MVISAFVLGIFATIVVIEIAAIIVIMLKMASMKKLVEDRGSEIEGVERNISAIDEALMREVDSVCRDLKEGLDRVTRDAFADSKSYTDSRIDKLMESIKK